VHPVSRRDSHFHSLEETPLGLRSRESIVVGHNARILLIVTAVQICRSTGDIDPKPHTSILSDQTRHRRDGSTRSLAA